MVGLTDLTMPYVGCGNRATANGVNGLLGALFGSYKDEGMRSIL